MPSSGLTPKAGSMDLPMRLRERKVCIAPLGWPVVPEV